MKTVRQCSLLVGCVLVALSASAFAAGASDESQIVRTSSRRADHKICYTIVGSGIPQPCDRFIGAFPTTANPIEIYGRKPRRAH